ncbi:MAG: hypothetical protein D3906_14505, partial [Candidatus Electrothrix sp. AUS1_2]|nr:hypothetical protein [Candidatus Electrothrix sp. AUS1_2]
MKSRNQKKTGGLTSGGRSTKELPWSNIGQYIQVFGLLLTLGVVSSSYMKKEGIGPYASTRPADKARSTTATVRPARVSGERTAPVLVEKVRPALVSVTSSWGRGAGFFLRENFIITGRHCVEPDQERMAALQEQIERNRKLLVLEEAKLANYLARLEKMRKGHEQDELKLMISERKKYLADFRFRQEQDEQLLAQ